MTNFKLTTDPLNVQDVIDAVRSPKAGAVNVFIGTVRDATDGKAVERLEYETYEPMALKKMEEIAGEIKQRWDVVEIAMHHRYGLLAIGDSAVVIAVSSPHRQTSFEACQYAIDTLKQVVPIWKKESFEDGDVWVMPHA